MGVARDELETLEILGPTEAELLDIHRVQQLRDAYCRSSAEEVKIIGGEKENTNSSNSNSSPPQYTYYSSATNSTFAATCDPYFAHRNELSSDAALLRQEAMQDLCHLFLNSAAHIDPASGWNQMNANWRDTSYPSQKVKKLQRGADNLFNEYNWGRTHDVGEYQGVQGRVTVSSAGGVSGSGRSALFGGKPTAGEPGEALGSKHSVRGG
eukprot:g8740.t1